MGNFHRKWRFGGEKRSNREERGGEKWASTQLCHGALLTIPANESGSCWFDGREAVTFPAETGTPRDISVIDVCSIMPRSVPESVQEHLRVI